MRFFSFLALFLSATAAAEAPVSATLLTDPLRESVQTEVSVSGNVIVGVMTLAAAGAITNNQIVVQSVANSADNVDTSDNVDSAENQVCLRVASRDGIYTSRNIYALPADSNGQVLLPYKSTREDVVGSFNADEIALAATPGGCDSGGSTFYLLSAGDQVGPLEVVIYLNSFGATDVSYKLDAKIKPCDYITEGRRTTFDHICRLGPVDAAESLDVTIIRERFGREQPSIKITIAGTAEVDVPQ